VALSYGTAYHGLKADRALFEMAVRALAEGNVLQAAARIVQVRVAAKSCKNARQGGAFCFSILYSERIPDFPH
jgi:hypothetical protein